MVYDGVDRCGAATRSRRLPRGTSARRTTRSAGVPRFTADDVAGGRRVVLIGSTVADELFPGVDPVGPASDGDRNAVHRCRGTGREGRGRFQRPQRHRHRTGDHGTAVVDRLRSAQPDPGPGDRTGHRSGGAGRGHHDPQPAVSHVVRCGQSAVPDPQPVAAVADAGRTPPRTFTLLWARWPGSACSSVASALRTS